MKRIDKDSVADLFLQLQWSSDIVSHTEAYAAANVNFWRDLLPRRLKETLVNRVSGDQVRIGLQADELTEPSEKDSLRTIRRPQFDGTRVTNAPLSPRMGRFYPKGTLRDMPNVFSGNREPFRLVEINNGHLTIDMGHPMAGHSVEMSVTVGSVRPKIAERGGSINDWGRIVTHGVGMQARWKQKPSDFFADAPFVRQDEAQDDRFYAHPRLVSHIDDTASEMVSQIYSRFILKGQRVLDLMSSWQSHLPRDISQVQVHGLGLNQEELAHNDQLAAYSVFDLNRNATLPFDDHHFDVAVCTVSVEYLTAPLAMFKEVARVLRPGGWFVVIFSNRWFETKAIRIWSELHEFERMGLVLEYFRRCKGFTDLGTYSIKGLERPAGDKYYGQIPFADPIYAVWGRTVSSPPEK